MLWLKATNLELLDDACFWVNDIVNKIVPFRYKKPLDVYVPRYYTIDSNIYEIYESVNFDKDQFLQNDIVSSTLNDVFNNFIGEQCELRDSIIVRSAAVNTEDWEHTWAGVYDSVEVRFYSKFDKFVDAVIKVYESTNSEHAKSYRDAIWFDGKESMSLIVQLKKTWIRNGCNVHNSSGDPYGAGHADFGYNWDKNLVKLSINGCSILFDKNKTKELIESWSIFDNLDCCMSHSDIKRSENSIFLSNFVSKSFDRYAHEPDVIIRVAMALVIIEENISEKFGGNDLQFEFGFDWGYFNGTVCPSLYMYQVRQLPKYESVIQQFTIDDDLKITVWLDNEVETFEPLKAGYVLVWSGNGNMKFFRELNPINISGSTNELWEDVLWVTKTAECWSVYDNLDYVLDHTEAIFSFYDNINNGHLETRCLERGICYLDKFKFEPRFKDFYDSDYFPENVITLVVCDWYNAYLFIRAKE